MTLYTYTQLLLSPPSTNFLFLIVSEYSPDNIYFCHLVLLDAMDENMIKEIPDNRVTSTRKGLDIEIYDHLFVCLLAGLHKYYWIDLHEKTRRWVLV